MTERPEAGQKRAGSDLRERILLASLRLFTQQGFYGTTTRQIAREAGTSESGILRVFDSKSHILWSVNDRCWREINKLITQRLTALSINATTADPREVLLSIFASIWLIAEENPDLLGFLVMAGGTGDNVMFNTKISDANMALVNQIADLAEKSVSDGLTPDGITGPALREMFLSTMEGVILGWYHAQRQADYPERPTLDDLLALISHNLYGCVDRDCIATLRDRNIALSKV